jgi:hypothetical protein
LPPRDTRTGSVLENMVLPALIRGGYSFKKQVIIGQHLGGRDHRVDVLAATPEGGQIPISLKWQQVSGTAEQKVPFEVICLAEAVRKSAGKFEKAYLVLGGEGWTLKSLYLSKELHRYLRNCEMVTVMSLESFVAKANKGKL